MQRSDSSHNCEADADRQTTDEGAKRSVGHSLDDPVHCSDTSQMDTADRQVDPDGRKVHSLVQQAPPSHSSDPSRTPLPHTKGGRVGAGVVCSDPQVVGKTV